MTLRLPRIPLSTSRQLAPLPHLGQRTVGTFVLRGPHSTTSSLGPSQPCITTHTVCNNNTAASSTPVPPCGNLRSLLQLGNRHRYQHAHPNAFHCCYLGGMGAHTLTCTYHVYFFPLSLSVPGVNPSHASQYTRGIRGKIRRGDGP